jgi:hypothetical protein
MAFIRIVIEVGNDFMDFEAVEKTVAQALDVTRLGISHGVTSGQTDFAAPGMSLPTTVRFRREYHPTDPQNAPSAPVTGVEETVGG